MQGEDSGDQFETLNDEVLTYSFSSHVASTSQSSNRPRQKLDQTPTLNIVSCKPKKTDNFLSLPKKQQKVKNFAHSGKTIRFGDVSFKSNFESGNMAQVEQISINNYKIRMQREINSNRTSAWFYYRCEGLEGEINFIITGFTKSASLYNQGMKICYRQLKDTQSQWKRGGSRIIYTQSPQSTEENTVYELRFTFVFSSQERAPVQFAYCFPYQYSRVLGLIKKLKKQGELLHQLLGKSYEGRQIPLLTFGNTSASKSIVLSARVHPGQSVSSFIMEGFLRELSGQSEFSKTLKQNYLIKVVPMINCDGVVRGNYRFSAAGYDLNRRWKHCYQTSHPQIYYLKNMIKALNKQKKVQMYIDIHGHTRKKNVFFYGCSKNSQEKESLSKPKEFPFLMQKINPVYKFDFCSFSVSRDKQGTARIAMWKQLKIDHVYTLESTFCGVTGSNQNFLEKDYIDIGRSLFRGISAYLYQKPKAQKKDKKNKKVNKTSQKTSKTQQFLQLINLKQESKEELINSPVLLHMGMAQNDSGSDSEPEAGFIPEEQRKESIKSYKLQVPQTSNLKRQFPSFEKSPKFRNNNLKKMKYSKTPTHKDNSVGSKQLKNLVQQKIENIKREENQTVMGVGRNRISTMTVNNFYSYNSQQLNSLTSQAIRRKNQRVHSKQVTRSVLQKIRNPRVNSQTPPVQFTEDNQHNQLLKIQTMNKNLLKTRQGVQFRRVKKIAQELKRQNQKFQVNQPPVPVVRGIVTVHNEFSLNKKRIKSIAPSFYPQSQQKSRRFSVEVTQKNKNQRIAPQFSNRKLFINGDQISVHCKGNRIFL